MPSLALEESQVSRKMADLQVLMLVNQKQEPRILPDLGAVAAFSNTAASALQRSFPNSEQLFFKRVAIDEFNMIYEGLRSNNPDLQKSYLPDPSQFDPVVGSLLNQGVPFQGAKQKALSQPFLFCPDPLIRLIQIPLRVKKQFCVAKTMWQYHCLSINLMAVMKVNLWSRSMPSTKLDHSCQQTIHLMRTT